tara:strand:+ start:7041 stop:7382 length:342 start_codon:yes stop_codon:yes gene_type:complete
MVFLPLWSKEYNCSYKTLINRKNLIIGECSLYNKIYPDLHYHSNSHEIYIILEGSGYVYNGNKWEYTEKGDIYEFKPYTYHALKTTGYIKILYIFNNGPFEKIDYNFKNKSKL